MDQVFRTIEQLRIPVEYLANILTAGTPEPVRLSLRRLVALRAYMREKQLGGVPDPALPVAVGLTEADLDALYRLLAIAKYDHRYVIPLAHVEARAGEPGGRGSALNYEGWSSPGGPAGQ